MAHRVRQFLNILAILSGLLPFYEYTVHPILNCLVKCKTELRIGFLDYKFYLLLLFFFCLQFSYFIRKAWLKRLCLIVLFSGFLCYFYFWTVLYPLTHCCGLMPKLGFYTISGLIIIAFLGAFVLKMKVIDNPKK